MASCKIVALWLILSILLPLGKPFSIGGGLVVSTQRGLSQSKTYRQKKDCDHLSLAKSPQEDPPTEKEDSGRGFFDFLSPYESKIPKAIEAEIYEAEGRTPAAQDRTKRVVLYTSLGIIGVLFAFFNGFLTELRTTPNPDGTIVPLGELGFGWVLDNPVASFIFTNKLGGGVCLLIGGASALLAEAEFDTRRLNAEKIYEELVRRRTERENKQQKVVTKKKKKRRNKTLEALAEVLTDNDTDISGSPSSIDSKPTVANDPKQPSKVETPQKSENLLDKMKDLYKRADTMAASQALLLNKKLEDKGILEKITDESGLRIVGKEAAVKKEDTSVKETADESSAKKK